MSKYPPQLTVSKLEDEEGLNTSNLIVYYHGFYIETLYYEDCTVIIGCTNVGLVSREQSYAWTRLEISIPGRDKIKILNAYNTIESFMRSHINNNERFYSSTATSYIDELDEEIHELYRLITHR